ncbi:MAG TPA: PRC-barrel domain-containing protein [Thermomicrobiales bacterium]|jgi:hypothetical protein|nr:PRC-barrel domain-containing protein [Thermomicrobiales bacterium]
MDEHRNDLMTAMQPGTDVYGTDGEKLGTIIEVSQDYLVVEKGLFFPTDYFVPMTAVSTAEPERVLLSVSRDEALVQGWDRRPGEQSGANSGNDAGSSGIALAGPTDLVAPADERERREGDPVTAGMGSLLGTIPPAADFATLGVAAVDVDEDYTDRGQPDGDPDPSPDDPSDPVGRPS